MSKWGDSIRESEDKSFVRVVYCEKCRYWHRMHVCVMIVQY